jgi:hypothetical protein
MSILQVLIGLSLANIIILASYAYYILKPTKKPSPPRIRQNVTFAETINYLSSLIDEEVDRRIKYDLVQETVNKDLRPAIISVESLSKHEIFAVTNILGRLSKSYINEITYFVRKDALESFIYEKVHDKLFAYVVDHNIKLISL